MFLLPSGNAGCCRENDGGAGRIAGSGLFCDAPDDVADGGRRIRSGGRLAKSRGPGFAHANLPAELLILRPRTLLSFVTSPLDVSSGLSCGFFAERAEDPVTVVVSQQLFRIFFYAEANEEDRSPWFLGRLGGALGLRGFDALVMECRDEKSFGRLRQDVPRMRGDLQAVCRLLSGTQHRVLEAMRVVPPHVFGVRHRGRAGVGVGLRLVRDLREDVPGMCRNVRGMRQGVLQEVHRLVQLVRRGLPQGSRLVGK